MDDEHVLALVEAVHGAHLDAVHGFAANAAIVDDVGQLGVLPADGADSCVLSFGAVQGMSSEGMSTTTRLDVVRNQQLKLVRACETWSSVDFALPPSRSRQAPPARRAGDWHPR
jgi:hypothetical protein